MKDHTTLWDAIEELRRSVREKCGVERVHRYAFAILMNSRYAFAVLICTRLDIVRVFACAPPDSGVRGLRGLPTHAPCGRPIPPRQKAIGRRVQGCQGSHRNCPRFSQGQPRPRSHEHGRRHSRLLDKHPVLFC